MKKRFLLAIALAACLSAAALAACTEPGGDPGTGGTGGTGGADGPVQSSTYTVTFDTNGGSSVASVEVENTGRIDLDDYGTTADGMYFYGWYLDEALTQRAPTQFTPTGDVTLYAAWGTRGQYTLTFDSCGGSSVAPLTFTAGAYLSAPADPSRDGYVFAGWYREADCVHEFVFAGNTMPAQDTTVYAKWTPLATLSFEMNGGDPIQSITGEAGTPVSQPADPEREGYVFDGWYQDAAFTTPYTFGTLPEASVTVYAKWHAALSVEATLHINFGELSETQTVTLQEGTALEDLGAEAAFEAAVNEAQEYTYLFGGWTFDAAGEQPAETVPAQESLTLYAQWHLSAKYCTVTFLNGENELQLIVEKTDGLTDEQKASVSAFYGSAVDAFVTEGGTAYTLNSTFVSNVRLTPAETGESFTFERSTASLGYVLTGYTGTETDVTVPALCSGLPVVAIGEGAFAGSAVTSLTLPDSIVSIGEDAFAGCTSLTGIAGGRYVSEIALGAFDGCTALEYVTEDGACYLNETCGVLIGVTAEAGTTQNDLLTFTVPARTTALAAGAFEGNTALEAVRFADGCSVTVLPASVFAGCTALTSVDCTAIPLTQVGESAFAGCTALTGVQLPASATLIGASAFENCSSLEELALSATHTGARAFAGSGLVTVDWNALRITAVPEGAFAGCTALTDITLPETLTAIEASAFEGCTALEKVTINASAGARIRTIGERAFYGCTQLRTVILFAAVTEEGPAAIAEDAFAGCADDLVIFVADGAPAYNRASKWYLEEEDRMLTFEEVYSANYFYYDIRTAEAILPSVNVGAGSFLVAADASLASADVLELLVGFGVTASDNSTPSEEIVISVEGVVRLTGGTDAAGSPAAVETPLEAVDGAYDLSEAGRYRVQVRAEDRFGNYSFDFVEIIVFD